MTRIVVDSPYILTVFLKNVSPQLGPLFKKTAIVVVQSAVILDDGLILRFPATALTRWDRAIDKNFINSHVFFGPRWGVKLLQCPVICRLALVPLLEMVDLLPEKVGSGHQEEP